MKAYDIKSPSGKIIRVLAENIYHAIEVAKAKENHQYTNKDYLLKNGQRN